MAYSVAIAPAAQRELDALPRDAQVRIAAKISDLAAEPRPPGVRKLAGFNNLYRVRVGDYRVVYQINDTDQSLLVTAIGHRSDIYRRGLAP